MISLINLSKGYGARTLFKDVSLTIGRGEKIGLIGPNGAGKSTLFNLIMKKSEPSLGAVQVLKNIRIGYLPQESSFDSAHTVLEELTEGDETAMRLKADKHELEKTGQAASHQYSDIMHRLEMLGYFELEYKAKRILAGLGFKERDYDRPIKELSGGWQMRTLLARLLTFQYDILLLDEPTNYLDLNAAIWFKDFLASFKQSLIMISHDKSFLNEVTNYTLILEKGVVTKVQGKYDDYRKTQEEQRQYLIRQYKEQDKKREQLKKFIQRFHGQPNKASQVRSKKKMLERLEDDAVVVPVNYRQAMRNFSFPQTRSSGYNVMKLVNVSKSYGELEVYKDFNLEVSRGEKIVLAGENGAGKSTLLKILAGVVEVSSGQRVVGHNVDIGYFSQTRLDVLNPDNTALEEVYNASAGSMSLEGLRTLLGAFLFRGDDVEKKVKVLSGGEKSRLILAKLLINPPNFLLLDEPTTHLDVDAVDALVRALEGYEGTLIFISHDIYFVRTVANSVYEVKQGQVRKFEGKFDYYMEKKARGDFKDIPEKIRNSKFGAEASPKGEIRNKSEKIKENDVVDLSEHNEKLAAKIRKLRKKKEKLELERYAKERVVSNPRHGDETVRYYQSLLKEIDSKLAAIDSQITRLKSKFINE